MLLIIKKKEVCSSIEVLDLKHILKRNNFWCTKQKNESLFFIKQIGKKKEIVYINKNFFVTYDDHFEITSSSKNIFIFLIIKILISVYEYLAIF